jgi:hypothetical protein
MAAPPLKVRIGCEAGSFCFLGNHWIFDDRLAMTADPFMQLRPQDKKAGSASICLRRNRSKARNQRKNSRLSKKALAEVNAISIREYDISQALSFPLCAPP